ncbi:hypothetical protein NCER_100734 [Vairimorpha ceranae BRL01]|uniref:Protein kinase domain-containing protein n=2 Tax=Vairimorpha ceranae TaxID=40302 RepID=C4V8C2_VAIC1|nr:mrk1-like ser thr protein kinase [Vairimorpha ceranae]EEQ82530.1 hypothetical protein NCER_100734 [Vairimorpha ceranae BRL01]KAF5139819.1 hypothetical protein G9O61_00g019890 [Vairimorpha ceranae]KKO75009.1 mrk1-like ser thr protein kinase [Vairimorpha ceranae]
MSESKLKDIKIILNNIVSIIVYSLDLTPIKLCFTYLENIGKGTFGIVIKVKDVSNNKIYALKKVYQDPKIRNRELDILKQTSHRNIVKLHFYNYENESTDGKILNLFLDYYPYDFETLIRQKKTFSSATIKNWAGQLISALEYLHNKGICHRDIKPANVLVDSSLDKLVVCDMGSAKHLKSGQKNIAYISSRCYRSPENILEHRNYNFKIDIWSAGCFLVQLHTGKVLFRGNSNQNMLTLILKAVSVTEADLLEMGCKHKVSNHGGIKEYLKDYVDDHVLLNLYDHMLVFNPRKRSSAKELLNLII